jgi:hypothetical protein
MNYYFFDISLAADKIGHSFFTLPKVKMKWWFSFEIRTHQQKNLLYKGDEIYLIFSLF